MRYKASYRMDRPYQTGWNRMLQSQRDRRQKGGPARLSMAPVRKRQKPAAASVANAAEKRGELLCNVASRWTPRA